MIFSNNVLNSTNSTKHEDYDKSAFHFLDCFDLEINMLNITKNKFISTSFYKIESAWHHVFFENIIF